MTTALQAEIARLLGAGNGLISRRGRPELANSLDWLVQQHRLVRLLPGVYTVPAYCDDLVLRMRAVALWDSGAVILEEAAAFLTFWPTIHVRAIAVSAPKRKARPAGYTISRRQIPAGVIVLRRGLRCTTPAATALDLCDRYGSDAIDAVLRSRQATLADLHEAQRLCAGRRGNALRRQLLIDSRTEPWSAAERQAHRLLHKAGIDGWRANYPVEVCGYRYWVDIAFPRLRLAVEIDGREFHEGAEVFEHDRYRQNDLVNAGWRVLRFTPRMLNDHPVVVIATIKKALLAY